MRFAAETFYRFGIITGLMGMLFSLWLTTCGSAEAKDGTRPALASEDFIGTTGIQPGEYQLLEGGGSCREGDLRLFNPGDGGLTLMLGARALVLGLGEGTTVEEERACRTENTAAFDQGFASGRRLETCRAADGEVVRDYHTVVRSDGGWLDYRHTVSENGTELRREDCLLRRVEGVGEAPGRLSLDELFDRAGSLIAKAGEDEQAREVPTRLLVWLHARVDRLEQTEMSEASEDAVVAALVEACGNLYAVQDLAGNLISRSSPLTAEQCEDIRASLLISFRGLAFASESTIPAARRTLDLLERLCHR